MDAPEWNSAPNPKPFPGSAIPLVWWLKAMGCNAWTNSRAFAHAAPAEITRRKNACRLRPLYNRLLNRLLLSAAQRDSLEVVLVSPRNPLNIGAAARAMANFGFERLSVVAPYAPTWREARSAVEAEELLQNAKSTERLAEAVADCTLVLATGTLTYRKPEQPVVSLPELAPRVARELARGGRVALVFGPEKHGLTREDLSYCHLLVEIPTDPGQPSMNLGQAVAVCLYELATRAFPPEAAVAREAEEARIAGQTSAPQSPETNAPAEAAAASQAAEKAIRSGAKCQGTTLVVPQMQEKKRGALAPGGQFFPDSPDIPSFSAAPSARAEAPAGRRDSTTSSAPTAPSGQLDRLTRLVEETLRAAGVSPRTLQAANRRDLRLLLRRLALSERDALRILGVFRRILWRLRRGAPDEGGRG